MKKNYNAKFSIENVSIYKATHTYIFHNFNSVVEYESDLDIAKKYSNILKRKVKTYIDVYELFKNYPDFDFDEYKHIFIHPNLKLLDKFHSLLDNYVHLDIKAHFYKDIVNEKFILVIFFNSNSKYIYMNDALCFIFDTKQKMLKIFDNIIDVAQKITIIFDDKSKCELVSTSLFYACKFNFVYCDNFGVASYFREKYSALVDTDRFDNLLLKLLYKYKR